VIGQFIASDFMTYGLL